MKILISALCGPVVLPIWASSTTNNGRIPDPRVSEWMSNKSQLGFECIDTIKTFYAMPGAHNSNYFITTQDLKSDSKGNKKLTFWSFNSCFYSVITKLVLLNWGNEKIQHFIAWKKGHCYEGTLNSKYFYFCVRSYCCGVQM